MWISAAYLAEVSSLPVLWFNPIPETNVSGHEKICSEGEIHSLVFAKLDIRKLIPSAGGKILNFLTGAIVFCRNF